MNAVDLMFLMRELVDAWVDDEITATEAVRCYENASWQAAMDEIAKLNPKKEK